METINTCFYLLPCGICSKTNKVCQENTPVTINTEPPIVSVYAAPAYPYNHMKIRYTKDTDTTAQEE